MSKAIADFLNVESNVIVAPSNVVAVNKETSIAGDADEARDNLKALMKTATQALADALNVAVQSESPRAFEVVATLIATAADLNTRLLATHTAEMRLGGNTTANTQNNNTTNNVVFSGTPSELSKLLKTL